MGKRGMTGHEFGGSLGYHLDSLGVIQEFGQTNLKEPHNELMAITCVNNNCGELHC